MGVGFARIVSEYVSCCVWEFEQVDRHSTGRGWTYRCSLRLTNLDISLEHCVVHEAERGCSHRHGHRNRDEVEDTLVLHQLEVIQTISCMSQGVNHPRCTHDEIGRA